MSTVLSRRVTLSSESGAILLDVESYFLGHFDSLWKMIDNKEKSNLLESGIYRLTLGEFRPLEIEED